MDVKPLIRLLRAAARRLPGLAVARGRLIDYVGVAGSSAGLQLRVPRKYAPVYYDSEGYEPLSASFFDANVAPGMSVIDVGAHIGFDSCWLARRVGATGHVLAVEPAKENVRFVQRNLKRNGLTAKVMAAGASSSTGKRSFNITGSTDSHGFYEHPNTDVKRTVTVPVVALDDVVDQVDFVKIDTEGAELDVLEGMQRLLGQKPVLLIEWTPGCQTRAGRGDAELVERLLVLGYRLSVLDDMLGRTVTVEEVLDDLRSGRLARNWYANVACLPM